MNGNAIALRAPWRVSEVHPLPGYTISVCFVDGLSGVVDLSHLVTGDNAGVFAALRDEEIFRQVRLELGAVTWPFDKSAQDRPFESGHPELVEGCLPAQGRPGDIDLAPDAMHAAIREKGEWIIS